MGKTHFKIGDVTHFFAEFKKENVKTFTIQKNVRADILEQDGAYQGQIILDTSTPAVTGGAGENVGGPCKLLFFM